MAGRDVRAEFTDFVTARHAHLRRIAYGTCGDWHRAEDIVQSALAKLYVAWPRVHRKGAEEAYARRIIMNTAVDESRRPWRRESAGLSGFDHPTTSDSDLDERHDLIQALQQLPEMQRKTVVLRHWLGLSVAETAHELGISDGTVKSHSARALERLHHLMSDPAEGVSR